MTATIEAPHTDEPPLPEVPDEATMVTLKIMRFNPEEPCLLYTSDAADE